MSLEKILGSKAKIRILGSLANKKELQLSEIKISTGLSLSTVHEAIKDLVDLRILIQRNVGKTRLYRINESNYFAKICIELINKESRAYEMILKEYAERLKSKNIESIIVFGSYARGDKSPKDIDVLVVVEDMLDIKRRIGELEGYIVEKYDVQISTLVFNKKELKYKFSINDRFVLNVISEGRRLFGKDIEAILYGKRNR